MKKFIFIFLSIVFLSIQFCNVNALHIGTNALHAMVNLSHEEKYPRFIIEMVEKYPETEIVKSYYDEFLNDKEYYTRKINIEDDLATDDVPLFIQWDKRWAFRGYGKSSVIATSACGPVCLSMVYNYFYKDPQKSPDFFAVFSYQNNYYLENYGTTYHLIAEGAKDFRLSVKEINIDFDAISKSIDEGKIIIALMKEGHFTTGGHYIVIKNYYNEFILVNDPNSIINSKKMWDKDIVLNEAKMMWALDKAPN